jgi:nicotinamide-nucleotide amidase
MTTDLQTLSVDVGHALRRRGWMLATAESCTGGWIAKAITDVSGSSAWFDRGFVTYTNEAKREMLRVARESLEAHGAVSEQVAREMAAGALRASHADAVVAVTGVAGPTGGSPAKPVGTVWFAWALRGDEPVTGLRLFDGNREAVRLRAAECGLAGVLDLVIGAGQSSRRY